MAKGFYISKTVGIVGIVLAVAAMSTIIALSVVYAQEKNKSSQSSQATTTSPTPVTTTSRPPTVTVSTTTPDPSEPWNRYRLPASLEPDSYRVTLKPHLTPNTNGQYIFEGSSTVRFVCKVATDLIIIHSKRLHYNPVNGHRVAVRALDGSTAPAIARTELVEATEFLVVHLQGQLVAGTAYEMDSSFWGELADDLAGFYRSEYTEGTVNKVVATTQMQATDARKSFPCFDEPAMKATFNITLIYRKGLTALSNMPPKHTYDSNENPNWQITEFETTPKMSTYLLAYIVSEFERVEDNTGNVKIGIWARPSAIRAGHGEYALNVTGPILNFFAEHYNTSYPLPKSDQVGLPDFNAGAMENWGLVTYRENALLYDPDSSSIGNKERVVTVIGHELAHQWFGNLVTLAWWNDLWLNEGFASYVEYLGADYAEPTWKLKDLMVLNDVYRVMAVDALASSHPLTTPASEINTPAQISELFDAISYSKGGSVLRMLSNFLTEPLFQKGLASYLKSFEYGNTVYRDLWDHLQQAVDNQATVQLPTTVSNIMDRWILQMGFPVITVDTSTGTISQKHFLLDPDSKPNRTSQFDYKWIAYITSLKNGTRQADHWLNGIESEQNTALFQTSDTEWLLLNIDVYGYYVVNYDQANWGKIRQQLQRDRSAIPVINRAQVIHDAFNLASAEMLNVTDALDNTVFLSNETEYMPWEAALDSLSYFRLMFDRNDSVYGPMQSYLRKQVQPLFNYFQNITSNWTVRPPTLMEQYNEINAISTACSNGIPECHGLVKDLYARWMASPGQNPIHPNLRSAVYCNAIAQGGSAEWDFAWARFREATLVNEADKLRAALACSKNVTTLDRYLNDTLNSDLIRRQDAVSTISSIASNVVGQDLVWNFVRSNWKQLFQNYGGGSFSFSNLIEAVTRRFSTPEDLSELEQFKQDNMATGFGSGTRALEQALEKTKANIKWVDRNMEAVKAWFIANSS